MDKPTKALILGVVVGALAAGVGLTNSHRLERKVQELQTRCVEEREKEAKTPEPSFDEFMARRGYSAVPPPPPGFVLEEKEDKTPGQAIDFKPICDPVELGRFNGKLVGTQEELASAQRELWQWNRHWKRWPISGGLAITVFFALPWVWYFLLRRVRELREALIGK